MFLDEPPEPKRLYRFEQERYDNVALEAPPEWGLDTTNPARRGRIFKNALKNCKTYLNIGAGFGHVEKLLPKKEKVCLDQSIWFLKALQKEELPNIWFICGFAEKMPFHGGCFPAVVSDSVFQTVVNQQMFLYENVRVLEEGGLLLLATHYRWNYPRKPQQFPAWDGELLRKFLHELGVDVEVTYYDLATGKKVDHDAGDYMVAKGTKK